LLIPIVADLAPSDNIFTRVEETFNDDYFSKRWQRARKKKLQRGIIEPGHTIYSFRHTAAIDLYRRTRDVSLLQRIMGHVEITTTMTYLRGLGELNEQDWEIGMPTFYGI
jgi:integrase